MNDERSLATGNDTKASAGAAGVGSGTLLVLISNALPEGHWAKPFLLWAAPTFSVTMTAIWFWGQRRILEAAHEREVLRRVDEARQVLEAARDDPNTAAEDRAQYELDLERLSRIKPARAMKRVDRVLADHSPGGVTVAD